MVTFSPERSTLLQAHADIEQVFGKGDPRVFAKEHAKIAGIEPDNLRNLLEG